MMAMLLKTSGWIEIELKLNWNWIEIELELLFIKSMQMQTQSIVDICKKTYVIPSQLKTPDRRLGA